MPERRHASDRRRGIFLLLVLACLATAVVSVALGVSRGADQTPGAEDGDAPRTRVPAEGAVIFRSLERRDPSTYGRIAWARLGEEGRKRTLGGLACSRIHFAAGRGLCLTGNGNPLVPFEARILGPDLRVRRELRLDGAPSRARVSPDGRYGTVTAFVSGHSYADPGGFSTQTTLIDMTKGETIADVEDFEVTRDGSRFRSIDFNFWGVTFEADSDAFYASLGTGGRTYLVRGDVSERSAVVLRENAECPSLSPDGERVVYKKLIGDPGAWRYHVLELSSGRETPLAETLSVDDQAEWLDDERVLYRVGTEVRVVPADGGGSPRTYLAEADSPAVVR